jgi:hypothetical protein
MISRPRPEAQPLLQATSRGIQIRVCVLPRSSRSSIVGIHEGALKIKLTKPPVDGQANAECCRVLAKHLGVPASRVSVAQGMTSRHKLVLVEGLALEAVRQRLGLL